MATNQHRATQNLGSLGIGVVGLSTFALNTAASGGFSAAWLAYAWNPSESKTLSAVKVFCSAVAGTLAATDLVCDIYSDTAGTGPNASLASSSTVTATPTGAAWVEFTGFSLALTAGTQYWIVLRNANAAPATNAPTYRYGGLNGWLGLSTADGPFWGSGCTRTSVNSGVAWSNSIVAGSGGWRLQYSDGTYDGIPISNGSSVAAASSTFGKQAIGMQFVVPPGTAWNIRGAQFNLALAGTPGPLVYKLYNGTTLLGTTTAMPAANLSGTRVVSLLFASSITVFPGTTLNLMICDTTTADTSTNAYRAQSYTVDNDANSFALLPFEGTAKKVLTTDYTVGAPTFTTDQTVYLPFNVCLDTVGEFTPGGALLFA